MLLIIIRVFNSGNYDNVDFKLTKLIYYSLNDNIYIRKFAIINCNGALAGSAATENCNSQLLLHIIQNYGGKSLSTFTKDGQTITIIMITHKFKRK